MASDSDDGLGTLLGTGLEDSLDPILEASMAVAAHRQALIAGDVQAVERSLDLHAHGAGPRGVLSRLAGKGGVGEAVKRLLPFFQQARFSLERARVLGRDEVEIYEKMGHPTLPRPIRTVSLVRRRGGYWRVVTTSDAPDERLRACIFCGPGSVDPLELELERCQRAFRGVDQPPAHLARDAGGFRLDHPEEGWQARLAVEDPFEVEIDANDPIIAGLLSEYGTLVQVALPLPDHRGARLRAIAWIDSCVAALVPALGPSTVYLPVCGRVLSASQIGQAKEPDARALARYWVHFHSEGGVLRTGGMSYFMLPELEASETAFGDSATAGRVVAAAAGRLLSGAEAFEPGTTFEVEGIPVRLALGRRGFTPGLTYGRWGSLALHSADP